MIFTEISARAKAGDINAIISLVEIYRQGLGIRPYGYPDYKKYAQEAAKRGNPIGMAYCGWFESKKELCQRSINRGLPELAKQNNHSALFLLSKMHKEGLGVEKDSFAEFRYLELAAQHGNREAQNDYGIYLNNNKITEGIKWLTAAADAKFFAAQYNLACCYMDGDMVPQNVAKATELLYASAEQDFPMAQVALASIYSLGTGVDKDYEKSTYWVGRAADKDNPQALYTRAKFRLEGTGGLPADDAKAFDDAYKAYTLGYAEALDIANHILTEAQGWNEDGKRLILKDGTSFELNRMSFRGTEGALLLNDGDLLTPNFTHIEVYDPEGPWGAVKRPPDARKGAKARHRQPT